MAEMLRISPVQREDGGVTLQVEGKPAREWVGVLERAARWRDLCERLGGRALPGTAGRWRGADRPVGVRSGPAE